MMHKRWIVVVIAVSAVLSAAEGRKSGKRRRNILDYDEDDEEVTELPWWLQNEVLESVGADREFNKDILSSLPQPQEVIYPVQVHKKEVVGLDTRDLKTQGTATHFRRTTIQLPIFGKSYKFRLRLNRDIMSKKLKQKRNIDEKTQIIEDGVLENCFYHGYARKVVDSQVALSTCDGFRGIIKLANTTYIIQPLRAFIGENETRHPHVLYPVPDISQMTCANNRGMWQPLKDLHLGEYLRRLKRAKITNEQKWSAIEQTKFVELALVADHSLFNMLNSSLEDTLLYLGGVANILDLYYQTLNIRMVVVYMEVWNYHDQLIVDRNPRATLQSFLNYKIRTLETTKPDAVQFISGQSFADDDVGMAIADSVCSERAVGVSTAGSPSNIHQGAAAAAHVLGHSLGLGHTEGQSCMCEDVNGCIMDSPYLFSRGRVAETFSSCSTKALTDLLMAGFGSCLFDEEEEESYLQTCGNGVLERGEECDCASREECEMVDPCCDRQTCLLKSWSTCRHGDCCYNCTVLPDNYMCRAPHTECDVPEFCTGVTGECPGNALIQDGQPCREDGGYCLQGKCATYEDQCTELWGEGAKHADDKCYETFNPAGRFNGHCGKNMTSYEYTKCHSWNVKCGLLHCSGGPPHPNDEALDKVFSKTNVVSEAVEYECKIVNDPSETDHLGMVEDGTRCGERSICMDQQCLPLEFFVTEFCPKGANNLTCSGNGVCTTEVRCFCHLSYTGADCGVKRNVTVTTHQTTLLTNQRKKATTPVYVRPKVTPAVPVSSTSEATPPVIMKASDPVSTLWLIIVLGSVAGGALILLGCCVICYRRKSPMKKIKIQQKKAFGSMTSFASGHSKMRDEIGDDQTSIRLISFGNMPSYRADKIKKMMKRKMGQMSGSESEHSRNDRDSTEIKLPQTLPLLKNPERGILKKFPRSADDLSELAAGGSGSPRGARPSELEPLRGRAAEYTRADVSANRGSYLHNSGGEEEALFTEDEEDPPGYSPPRERPGDAVDGEEEDMEFDDEEDGEFCEDCDCESCDSCDKKSFSSEYDSDAEKEDFSRDQMTQTDPNSPTGAAALAAAASASAGEEDESIEGAKNKILKLKNINDLLKQIDEQFNSVLRQTTDTESPTNSDEVRGSETEADRQYPRNSFYRQSDIEEGYSPPHRSPLLSPSTEGGSKRYSSNLSSGSPDPLPSPSGVLSPIYSRSPLSQPPLSSPGAQAARPIPTARQHSTPREGATAGTPPRRGHGPKPTPPKRLSSVRGAEGGGPRSSPARHDGSPSPPGSNPPVSAIPYRGAKTVSSSSIPGSPPPAPRAAPRPENKTPSPKPRPRASLTPPSVHSPKGKAPRASPLASPAKLTPPHSPRTRSGAGAEASPRHQSPLQKLVHPLLDGYPFKKRGSLSNDGQSISEGYHSDRADTDEPIIIREIPKSKPRDLPFMPNPTGAYTRAPGSPGSPEDINV